MSRTLCLSCRKAEVTCYCRGIESFASQPQFVILLHPKEARKAINTGRMAFLHLQNAWLLTDSSFDEHEGLQKLINDPRKRCFLLFPGPEAQDIATWPKASRGTDLDDVFIILDATWAMARSMLRQSRCLQALPRVMFYPPRLSEFVIRKQPRDFCFSTIETIHHIIEIMGTQPAGEHHRLLEVFRDMVQKQIDFELKHQPGYGLG